MPVVLAVLIQLAATPRPPVADSASRNVAMAQTVLPGVNISGCEFADNGALCPTPTSVRQYVAKGFRLIRIPFKSRQMTDPNVTARIRAAVVAAIDAKAYVMLDRHGFDWGTPRDQVEQWVAFLRTMPKSPQVIVDVMNEPKNVARAPGVNQWIQWASDSNEIIARFRARGVGNVIALEWPQYSATFRFDKHEKRGDCLSAGCALDRIGGLRDPKGLTLLSGHDYLDKGSAGSTDFCDKYTHITGFAEALRRRGLKGQIGEFGFGSYRGIRESCRTVGQKSLDEMRAAPDVIHSYAVWGGGAAWNDGYTFKIEPTKGSFEAAPPSDYLKALVGQR